MNVFWFRRDLRLDDNHALCSALQESEQVLPVFIYDPAILEQLERDDHRLTFIHQQLSTINRQLAKAGRSLATFYGDPAEVFAVLASGGMIDAVYANEDYEPYARRRDEQVGAALKLQNASLRLYKDQVIFAKSEILKSDRNPYVVFTPYSNKWKCAYVNQDIPHYPSQVLLHKIATHQYPFLELHHLDFRVSEKWVPDYDLSDTLINAYQEGRDFPALRQTSGLSTHLRFGTVSIRTVVKTAAAANNQALLNELIWREFFMQILWHFPNTIHKSFRPQYDAIRWINDEHDFEMWCEGKTGYPIVDAGMRELKETGLMHNRVRMIVAGFLCKHLLIDWRWGESWFAQNLFDYEQSSNVGNWQWAAGSGVDAAPYFRIFNPSEQARKFDKEGAYIRRWVPEVDTPDYPRPIVEHTYARERCIRVYKQALFQST